MFHNYQITPDYSLNLLNKDFSIKNSITNTTNPKQSTIEIVEKAPPYILDNYLISSFRREGCGCVALSVRRRIAALLNNNGE